MRFLFTIVILLTSVSLVKAQACSGVVVDDATGALLADVVVTSTRTGNMVLSNSEGRYVLQVGSNDTLLFHRLGYQHKRLAVLPVLVQKVFLTKSNITIDTIVISGSSRYQRDSIERRSVYSRKLEEKPAKFGMHRRDKTYGSDGPGAGTFRMEAPISALIQKRTKKYKRLKAFQERFRKNEEQLFVDTRYTPELVQELTGLAGDTVTVFMNQYPMSADYARSATDLEIKMWIRYHCKDWTNAPKRTGVADILKH